jgi:threonine synthase
MTGESNAAVEPLFDLACAACGETYPRAGFPAVCSLCGGFWKHGEGFAWRPPGAAGGLRRWAAALGLEPDELPDRPLSSPPGLYALDGGGEGTAAGREPGVPAAAVAPAVWICQQGSAPSGTYKERGAEVMVAAARRRGVRELFLDSSGNAGIAVARAAAERGIRCTVLVPATTAAGKIERIRAAGGHAEVVPGDRDATHRAAAGWRRRLPYAAPFFQPSFLAGVATLAWDLAGGLGAPLPEHWLLPAGNGPLLLGLALGLSRLHRAGLIGRLPALHAVQLAGYAALAPGGPGEAAPGPPTAAGLAIAHPPRRADLLRALEASGGDVTRVSEEAIAAARRELAGRGWTADPTGAAAFAGYRLRGDLQGLAAARPKASPPAAPALTAEAASRRAPACLVIVTSREAELE